MISRRRLLQMLSLFAATPWLAEAYPISRILGPVEPAYLHAYIERMWTWYNREFFSFPKAMTKSELEFFKLWKHQVPNWGLDLNRNQMFESFLFSHRGEGAHLNSSRLALGLTEWPKPLLTKAHEILRAKKAAFDPDLAPHFYGLGWDFEKDEMKTYYLFRHPDEIQDHELLEWSNAHKGDPWINTRIAAYTFAGGKRVKKKLIVPMSRLEGAQFAKNNPFDIVSATKIIETGGRTRWHYRLRSFFFPLVNPVVHRALSEHSIEFEQVANSLIFEDFNHYTFYYP